MSGFFNQIKDKIVNRDRTPILKSIMTKLVLLYLALVLIVMLASGTFIYMAIRTQEASKAEEELKKYASYIEENFLRPGHSMETINERLYDPEYSILVTSSEVQAAILDKEGNTLVPFNRSIKDNSVIFSAMRGVDKFDAWNKGFDNDAKAYVFMSYALPVFTGGELTYIIYVTMDSGDIIANIATITNIIAIAVVIAMVLAAIVGWLFSSTLTGPIFSLTRTAKEMAQGNLQQEIKVKGDDEIGQLTQSFNYMAKSLDKTLSDMISEKNRIEIILNNMTDGVLAYDADNNLLHANYASLEMLGVRDIESLKFVDVMAILELDIENVLEMDKENNIEDQTRSIDDRFISLSFNSYKNQSGLFGGIVMVLQDVTKHTKLDNMRKEFVANVSHELRTPLTTVKSYAETLLEGALEDRELSENFLNVINNEADRMTVLTKDLLELSRFDNNQLKMNMEEIDLRQLINNCIRQNTIIAQQKEQRILYENPKEEMSIMGDPDRINQVINNVISNAIKYSKEQTEIKIKTDAHGKYYRIYISDNGIGVPKEDLKRIFERFYRVDKARSRSMGGTGLGLAIAKEIMDAHGGKISAISEPDVGTTMILRFNKIY